MTGCTAEERALSSVRPIRKQERFQTGGRCAYLLNFILGDVMQRAVGLQADPHVARWELRRPLVGLQLSRCIETRKKRSRE